MHKLDLKNLNTRTDLAIELSSEDIVEEVVDNIKISRLFIKEENEKKYNKKSGNYITIEYDDIMDYDSSKKVEKVLIKELKKILKKMKIDSSASTLIIGLGNEKSTPDALGPSVVNNIIVTSYLFNNNIEVEEGFRKVSAFSPGVTGITGIETYDIISSIVEKIKPSFLIVIDSLKASSLDRLNKTIQITDTGISPGSGIGNKRKEISLKTVKIPVISIGVPTVVDTDTIISETINKEVNSNNNFIVTTTDIDLLIQKLGVVIGISINNTLHKKVTHL